MITRAICCSILLTSCISFSSLCQVIDDFSDGDLTTNPTWSGNTEYFPFNAGESKLRSQGPDIETSYFISTPNQFIKWTTWEFSVKLSVSPSNTNNMRIYLVADQENLTTGLNGYFIRIGESGSNDGVDLYRQNGTNTSRIMHSFDGAMASGGNARIRVTRDDVGNWTLAADLTGENNFIQDEASVFDDTFTSASKFGIVVNQTSSNKNNYYFGSLSVTANLIVESVEAISKNTVKVHFNQAVTEATGSETSNYTIDNGVTVNSATRSGGNSSVVELTVSDLTTDDYLLTVSNLIKEQTGTLQETVEPIAFSYTQLALSDIITPSSTELKLIFNDELDEAAAENVSNYTINGGIGTPTGAVLNPSNTKEVLLTLSTELGEQAYELTLPNGLPNASGNSQIDPGAAYEFDFVVPLIAESVEVASKNQLIIRFNKAVAVGPAETPENYTINNSIGAPSSAAIGTGPNEVILTLGTGLLNDSYEISISNLTDLASTGLSPNPTVLPFSYLPLTIDEVSVTGENTLQLTFNQAVDPGTAGLASNYSLNDGFGNPQTASVSEADDKVVELTFSEDFFNFAYELTVNGVTNLSGNAVAENIVDAVAVTKATPAGALIITEIFADPNPKGISPESPVLPTASGAEFVEIYNPSPHSINLNSFNLTGGTIGSYLLSGGSYVALVPATYLTSYEALGNATTITSWNSLTNTGEVITLKDQIGNTIDEVTFSSSWNDDSEKDGGWSFEKINPVPACENSANWRTSIGEKGATPGAQNSVFDDSPDTTSPTVAEVEIVDAETIAIHFNEKMDTGLAGITASLNGEDAAGLSFPDDQTLSITLTTPLVSEAQYALELAGLSDCAGNSMANGSIGFYYDTKPPVPEQVVLRSFSSLLLRFDEPLKETDAEKEENYKIVDLETAPAKANLLADFPQSVLLEFEEPFALGASYEIEVSYLKDTLENAMGTPVTLAFSVLQQIDSVWVEGANFLSVSFNMEPDKTSMTSADNYSVNGEAKPLKVLPVAKNIARLIFENNFSENKNLVLSISNLVTSEAETLITPDYIFRYDTKPPTIDSVVAVDAKHLLAYLNERLQAPYAEATGNYEWKGHGHPDSVALQMDKKSVLLSFGEPFPQEIEQELAVINLKDLYGNQITKATTKPFVYDTLSPRVETVVVTSPKTLEISFSEPVTTAASAPDHYLLGSKQPSVAKRTLPDSNVVALTFADPLPDVNSIPLAIDGISDFYGNTSVKISTTVNNEDLQPGKAMAISASKALVSFNKALGSDLTLSNVAGSGIAALQKGNETHLLELEVSGKFEEDSLYTFAFNGLASADGIALGLSKSISFTYHSGVLQLTSKHPALADLLLSVPVNKDSLSIATNMIVEPGAIIPSLILPDADEPEKVNIYFDENLPFNETLTLTFSELYDVWSRRVPDQSISFAIDAQAPTVANAFSRLFSEVIVEFSEKVSSSTALSPNHYTIIGLAQPNEVVFTGADQLSVSLFFESDFVDKTTYQLVVKNVEDISGNVMQADTLSFTYARPNIPKTGEVLITEIMADPSPSVGLPEVEYVELFNNSGIDFELSAFGFVNSDKAFALGEGLLPAGSYLMLCSPNDTASLADFGAVAGLTGWSALSNSKDSLSLINYYGDVIDQAVYTTSWYKDSQKDEGGWSLERILGESACGEDYRWAASQSELGGTPGAANSLAFSEIDSIAPAFIDVAVVEPTRLSLGFSEWISEVGLAALKVDIKGGPEVATFALEENQTSVLATLKQPLTLGAEYLVTVAGVVDCSGNEMEVAEMTVGVGRPPIFGELIISEVMPDPDPTQGLPEAEYIEIFNPTSEWVSYNGVSLIVGEKQATFPKGAIAPNSFLILCSSGSQPRLKEFGATLVITSIPSLKNDGDKVSLFIGDHLLHRMHYDDGLFANNSKKDGGWSLEIIDVNLPCAGEENWIASANQSGGTPGQINSVNNTLGDGMPPSLLEAIPVTDSTLLARLSEQVIIDSDKLEISITPSLGNLTVQADFLTNSFTIQHQESIRPGTFYTVSLSGLVDCRGNISLAEQLSASFILPSPSDSLDVVINEILFNPRSGGVDFVELYNRSDKYLDIKGWEVGNITTATGEPNDFNTIATSNHLLAPGDFLVLTESPTILKADYPSGKEETFFEADLPTYPNTEGGVIIRNVDGLILDWFNYDEDLHSPFLEDVKGVALERVSAEHETNDPENWESGVSTTGFATPGYKNASQRAGQIAIGKVSAQPEAFIPGDGLNGFTEITFDSSLINARIDVNIYDMGGRKIKTLTQGQIVADGSFFRWDGSTDMGEMVRVGVYIIQVEYFNSSGQQDVVRTTVAVGARF
ncbi:MAG: lamin tail domain-containing protein [Imperialibacter sp.]|uniref:lamin tail domain-containing protein n=1 Tax=Imperialibacter sp. TaxID=2038411 RepID=UPI0032EE5825